MCPKREQYCWIWHSCLTQKLLQNAESLGLLKISHRTTFGLEGVGVVKFMLSAQFFPYHLCRCAAGEQWRKSCFVNAMPEKEYMLFYDHRYLIF